MEGGESATVSTVPEFKLVFLSDQKIAAALPGMQALSSRKDDQVGLNVKSTSNAQADGKAGVHAC